MNLLADTIGERTKPVIAFIDDFAASAAYGIASACDHIVANNNMAWVGSIGCYTTFVDYSKYWEKEGIRVEDIYADQSTEKNSEYREALKGNFEPMRKITSHFAEDFISRVENSRGEKLTAKRDVWATGKMFFAPQALKIGLIDEINSFENLIKNLL
ncbi:MAG: S49 family peptidase [Paludibacter sp.]|nr:S49 family peptidase [Paludibacter sp.]